MENEAEQFNKILSYVQLLIIKYLEENDKDDYRVINFKSGNEINNIFKDLLYNNTILYDKLDSEKDYI